MQNSVKRILKIAICQQYVSIHSLIFVSTSDQTNNFNLKMNEENKFFFIKAKHYHLQVQANPKKIAQKKRYYS